MGRFKHLFCGVSIAIWAMCLSFSLSNEAGASQEAAYRHNTRGVARLQAGDYIGAIEDLRTAHRYLPANEDIKRNLGIAHNNYAFHLKSRGALSEAIVHYSNALQYDSNNPYTHYNLGQAYYQVQNMPRAREFLEKAYDLDPSLKGLKGLLSRVKGEASAESAFDRIETMHFIVAADRTVPSSKVSYIRTHLEEAYGRVGMILDHYPQKKTIAVIFSEDSYDSILKGVPPWSLALYDGKIRLPADRFRYDQKDVRKIIYHEYAHVVVRELTAGNCPVWLNEGIAGLAESLIEPKDKAKIRRYVERFGIVPLRSIPEGFADIKRREIMTLLYIESYLLVEFMVRKFGYEGLRRVLRELRAGNSAWAAISGVSEQSMADFEQEWARFLAAEYGWEGAISP
ncbi:MAG: tetratricopeptide repeat protein [Candidatus Omnitrophota bacterium]